MKYLYVNNGIVVNGVEYPNGTTDTLTPEGYDIVSDNGAQVGDFHPVSHNKPILAQIADIEKKQHRTVREAAIGVAGATARLITIDGQIAALRATLL